MQHHNCHPPPRNRLASSQSNQSLSPFSKRKRNNGKAPAAKTKKRKLFVSDSKENGENFGFEPHRPRRDPLSAVSSSPGGVVPAGSSSSSSSSGEIELKVEEALVSMFQLSHSKGPGVSSSSPLPGQSIPTTPKPKKDPHSFHPLVTPMRGSSSQMESYSGPLWSYTAAYGGGTGVDPQQQSGPWTPPPAGTGKGGEKQEEMVYKVNLWLFEYDCCVRKIESDPQGCMESLFALMRILKGTIPELPCFEQYHWWCFVGAMYYAAGQCYSNMKQWEVASNFYSISNKMLDQNRLVEGEENGAFLRIQMTLLLFVRPRLCLAWAEALRQLDQEEKGIQQLIEGVSFFRTNFTPELAPLPTKEDWTNLETAWGLWLLSLKEGDDEELWPMNGDATPPPFHESPMDMLTPRKMKYLATGPVHDQA